MGDRRSSSQEHVLDVAEAFTNKLDRKRAWVGNSVNSANDLACVRCGDFLSTPHIHGSEAISCFGLRVRLLEPLTSKHLDLSYALLFNHHTYAQGSKRSMERRRQKSRGGNVRMKSLNDHRRNSHKHRAGHPYYSQATEEAACSLMTQRTPVCPPRPV
jgi:hypothetical protein